MDLSRVAQGTEDLRSSLEYGVQPSLRACVQHGGGGCLLVLIRKVFAYVEFLGALWGGPPARWIGRRRRIAKGRKSVTFLEEVLGAIDLAYRDHGRLIYEMFRHGRCTSSDLTS